MAKLLFILPLFAVLSAPVLSLKNLTTILDELKRKADPLVRPHENTGGKEEVSVVFQIHSLHAANEASQEMALDVNLVYFWTDPRLQYTDGPSKFRLQVDAVQDSIWIPDLFFPAAREQTLHGLLKDDAMIGFSSDGSMFFSARVTIHFECGMDLHNFPMDTQRCQLRMESYALNNDKLKLKFKEENPVKFNEHDQVVAFSKREINNGACSDEVDNYSCLFVEFVISRISTHYIVLIYIPSFLLMALGALVFWFPLGALFERTFFSAFLIFTQAVILAASQYGSPQVGYLKAIDAWVVGSFIFLFVVQFEVIVLFLLARNTSGLAGDTMQLQNEEEPKRGGSTPSHLFFLQPTFVKRLDLAFRIAYPLAVLLFIIVYACVYHI